MLKTVNQSLRDVCATSGECIKREIVVCNAVLVSHVEESTSWSAIVLKRKLGLDFFCGTLVAEKKNG